MCVCMYFPTRICIHFSRQGTSKGYPFSSWHEVPAPCPPSSWRIRMGIPHLKKMQQVNKFCHFFPTGFSWQMTNNPKKGRFEPFWICEKCLSSQPSEQPQQFWCKAAIASSLSSWPLAASWSRCFWPPKKQTTRPKTSFPPWCRPSSTRHLPATMLSTASLFGHPQHPSPDLLAMHQPGRERFRDSWDQIVAESFQTLFPNPFTASCSKISKICVCLLCSSSSCGWTTNKILHHLRWLNPLYKCHIIWCRILSINNSTRGWATASCQAVITPRHLHASWSKFFLPGTDILSQKTTVF